jgi:hypothetical protein
MSVMADMRDQIRASSLRRQHFESVLQLLNQPILQLLRDMRIRWSSTLLMIEQAILLRDVCKIHLILTILTYII